MRVINLIFLSVLFLYSSYSYSTLHNYVFCGNIFIPCSETKLLNFLESCSSSGRFGCHLNRPFDNTIGGRYVVRAYSTLESVPPEHLTDKERESLLASTSPLASPINNGHSCNNTSHPINIATGNKFFQQTDYLGQGASPLAFSVYFNSNYSVAAGADKASLWNSDYRQSLIVTSDVIKALRPNGQTLTFSVTNGIINSSSNRSENLLLSDNGYELVLSNNVRETYTVAGKLLSIRYPNGIVHNLTYGIDSIVVTRGAQSLFLSLNNGYVESVTLPNGDIVSYNYGASYLPYIVFRQLIDIKYQGIITRSYLYDPSGEPLLLGIIDANNNRISSVTYDAQGRAISSEVGELGSGIERIEIEYHDDGTRTVTNSLGKKNKYHFTEFNGEYKMTLVEGEASANCAAANQAYTYDANGLMASKTDWQGNVTTYIHNDRGLEISRTEASGTPQARTITTEWHPTFNLRTKVSEPQRETIFNYDEQGRLVSQEVNSQ